MLDKALTKEVEEIKWFHKIDLGNGIETPGVDDSSWKLQKIRMPLDLSGKSVLDIGAWDGFFSFEAERRGASRVLATDFFYWEGDGWGTKEGFELARRELRSNVEDQNIDVLEISPDTVGVFDVVLFLGVLYHMRHSLLALEHVSSVTAGLLILETHVDLLWTSRPAFAFYPGSEASRDPSNWCGPNPAAVSSMLRDVGFEKVEVAYRYPISFRLARTLKYFNVSPIQSLQQSRYVFHAWK